MTGIADWQSGSGYRYTKLTVPGSGKTGFAALSPDVTGIHFTNTLAQSRHLTNQVLYNGSGVAAGDVDGDGLIDLYFAHLDGPNKLYRNLGGWKFEEIAARVGVACENMDATGVALVDLTGDGALDLVVNSNGHGTHVFRNDGKGNFQPLARLNGNFGGTSLAAGDLDGDGFLDLYLANYRVTALMDMPNAYFTFKQVNGQQMIDTMDGRPVTEPDLANRFRINERGTIEELGEPDMLYRNIGGTNFAPVPFARGNFLDANGQPLKELYEWGLAVMFRDINGDGRPDIYLCNDFQSPERIWLNLGNWRFQEVPLHALRKTSLFAMGVDFADLDRDGFDDFFVLDMLSRDHAQRMNTLPSRQAGTQGADALASRPQYSFNTVFRNRGDGTYAEIAQLSGLAATEWSWAAAFMDVDLDGWEDVLVTNGTERDGRNLDVGQQLRQLRTEKKWNRAQILQSRTLFPRYNSSNLAYRNRHDLTFEDTSKAWGFDFDGVSHGMALADLDNDGDLDVMVNNLNAVASVYRNESIAPRVAVRLRGASANTTGIGARIVLEGGPVTQSQELMSGGRYLSSDAPERVFAASADKAMTLRVTWPSGKQSVVADVRANHRYEVDEAGAQAAEKSVAAKPKPLFEDVSARLSHTHVDEPFDDFARQPLLPNLLSQLGPGVAWFDLDRDGWEDLLIGSGRGGLTAVYRNDGKGSFQPWQKPSLAQPVARDQTAMLAWHRVEGQAMLLAGSANYEDGMAAGPVARLYDLASGAVDTTLPAMASSAGTLALADFDGDGQLDLFVGGRVVPGRYPEAASSLWLRGRAGKFEAAPEIATTFTNVGMVTGSVASDLDGDGRPELVLACDWSSVRVFRWQNGKFAETTSALGLSEYRGWWNGVATGDFNGDGRMDIVASNWGRNSRYESERHHALTLYHGDFLGDGNVSILEAHIDPLTSRMVPWRMLDTLATGLPFIKDQFPNNRAYGEADVAKILGEAFPKAQKLEANWLETTVFLNEGNRFRAVPLPMEAQMSPAFGVNVGDLDGDGHEDIFLSQNFFGTPSDVARYDASTGLVLRGDGKGGFAALRPIESGLMIHGEQRGSALADFDNDGRVDLIVSQNSAATRLFRNAAARPGLRVRLQGVAGNLNAIGTRLRVKYADGFGPMREVQTGSGHWSQNGFTQVLGLSAEPVAVEVFWLGGKTVTVTVPAGNRELTVSQSSQ